MRILILGLALLIASCSPEQSKNIGAQPKKTIDNVTNKVNDAMKQGQGSERLREDQK
jgi:PBP1b-binding outer membrane lipoprotein LpoB